MAKAGAIGGAAGFRANMPENVRAIKEALPEYPMFGIYELINNEFVYFSDSPNINPYTIRTIYCQPNHIRCWKSDVYRKIYGHNYNYSIADDYELVVRTFLEQRGASY